MKLKGKINYKWGKKKGCTRSKFWRIAERGKNSIFRERVDMVFGPIY
jgi:hypothetical protein